MTITVRLPDEIEAKLRERLGKDDLVLTEFVRQAITEKLEKSSPQPDSKPEPATALPSTRDKGQNPFGRYSSGREDLSENYEEILREKLRAKHRG